MTFIRFFVVFVQIILKCCIMYLLVKNLEKKYIFYEKSKYYETKKFLIYVVWQSNKM